MGKMAEMQRKLLEQMMGPEAMGIQTINHDWWEEKVCKNYLFGTCPHILFGNTKMDLGPCPKIHSDRILAQFREAQTAPNPDPRIAIFRQEHENALYGFIDDCDRRIRMAQRKLEKTPEENRKTVDLMREIGEIELSIQGGTEEIEALGEAGKVEESMAKLAAVDALKQEKANKERELQDLNENAGASGHQKLRVCEICGAMLSVLDSDKRLADHFGGKLHLGYQELRKLLSTLAEARMSGRPAPIGGLTNGGPPPPPGAPPVMPAPTLPPASPAGRSSPPPPPAGPGGPGPAVPHGAPAGPGAPRRDMGPSSPGPHTPLDGPRAPSRDELPAVGHGDKVKREAGELYEDVRGEKDRERERERDRENRDGHRDRRSSRDAGQDDERERERERERRRRHRDDEGDDKYASSRDRDGRSERKDRDREDRYDRYDKYDREDRRSSRYDDRDRRDRRYEDDRSAMHERSRSPPKRRLV